MSLSLIVVTKNEAHNIADCLKSVDFADEIIVIDSGSTDKTIEICRQFTDKVVITDWAGDGPQKLRALALATKPWVLCLDADERVTPALKAEILQTLPNTTYEGFEIPYVSEYCGKKIYYGDWKGEKHLRLFRRDKGQISPQFVHCKILVKGGKKKIGLLKSHINHLSFPNLEAVLKKVDLYSTESAKLKYAKKQQGGLFKAFSHGLWAFIRGYILKFGFLDGQEGFMLAISNAEGTYYRYLKLYYLYKNGPES